MSPQYLGVVRDGRQRAEERKTDMSAELARHRYRLFQRYFGAIISLQEHFTFTMIDATDSLEIVQSHIKREFEYQSENEIGSETLDTIQVIVSSSLSILLVLAAHSTSL
jgi:hypothetical protein